MVKKLQRFSQVLTFLAVYAFLAGPHVTGTILETPIFFFATIMLTEPQTTPPKKLMQIIYGGLIGAVSFYQPPEIALLAGNIFSYIVSPKEKLVLRLKEKIQIAPDIYEFIFGLNRSLVYQSGQYMEWTLGQKNPDSRGSRRCFTIASSPTEDDLKIGVKFYPNGSSFKRSLISLKPGANIVAAQLSGEFTLSEDPNKKLVFIAGGIGITPFRSIIKYLLDKKKKRDIILFYSNKKAGDIVYKDIFDQASRKLGIRVLYINTDTDGYLDEKIIRKEIPDFNDRVFYLSGPHGMVDSFKKTLQDMGVFGGQIKTDYFPGY